MKYNAAQLALIAAGATADAIAAAATADDTSVPTEAQLRAAAEAETARVAAEAEAARVAAEAAAAEATAAAAAAATKPTVATPDPVVTHLTAQLAASNEAVTAAKIEAASYKAAAESVEGLLAIARASLGNLYVAFNGSAATAETFNASTIVAEHARMSAQFKEKFRVGGVAVTPKPQESAPDPVAQAVISYHIPN